MSWKEGLTRDQISALKMEIENRLIDNIGTLRLVPAFHRAVIGENEENGYFIHVQFACDAIEAANAVRVTQIFPKTRLLLEQVKPS